MRSGTRRRFGPRCRSFELQLLDKLSALLREYKQTLERLGPEERDLREIYAAKIEAIKWRDRGDMKRLGVLADMMHVQVWP